MSDSHTEVLAATLDELMTAPYHLINNITVPAHRWNPEQHQLLSPKIAVIRAAHIACGLPGCSFQIAKVRQEAHTQPCVPDEAEQLCRDMIHGWLAEPQHLVAPRDLQPRIVDHGLPLHSRLEFQRMLKAMLPVYAGGVDNSRETL